MNPTYLELVYDGNYAGRNKAGGEYFTYKGNLYLAYPSKEEVFEIHGWFYLAE